MCGIVGISNCPDAATLAYLGLYGLQHRGQESTGIAVHDGKFMLAQKGRGKVNNFFTSERLRCLNWFDGTVGRFAVGHNRYSTSGKESEENIQPLITSTKSKKKCSYMDGLISIVHNGNITNATKLREELESEGFQFRGTSDTEVILHLVKKYIYASQFHQEALLKALEHVEGAYSLILLSQEGLVAARDSYGFRPLCIGKFNSGYVLASEPCALDLMGADYIRDIQPGEVVSFSKKSKTKISYFLPQTKHCPCSFELIYFSRPDSNIFDKNVYLTRKELGRQLARESYIKADYVIPVPDSGVPAAIGYAEESGIPFEMGLIRNHYIDRTFIEPEQQIRNFGVKVKLNPVKELLRDKTVIVVDDSLVRGTTSKKIIQLLRQSGVAKIHIRISSPPVIYPCYYGIDIPTKEELIASDIDISDVCMYIGADSLHFLSYGGMKKSLNGNFCTSCFTGKCPL